MYYDGFNSYTTRFNEIFVSNSRLDPVGYMTSTSSTGRRFDSLVFAGNATQVTTTNWSVGDPLIDMKLNLSGYDYPDYDNQALTTSTNISTSAFSRYFTVTGANYTGLDASRFAIFNNIPRAT